MLRPSTYPRSCIPRTNDSRYGSLFEVPARRYPTRGVFSGCCARAATGHAAAPPMNEMKSRRFTARCLPCFGPKSIRHQAAGRDVLLGGVLCRGLLDHGRNNGIVGRDPIRRDIPFFAIPGLDAARPRAFVISARDLDRLQLVLEAELLEPLRSQVEIFEAPSDLLAGQRLLAELLLRCADCFDAEHGID